MAISFSPFGHECNCYSIRHFLAGCPFGRPLREREALIAAGVPIAAEKRQKNHKSFTDKHLSISQEIHPAPVRRPVFPFLQSVVSKNGFDRSRRLLWEVRQVGSSPGRFSDIGHPAGVARETANG
jgi:hypothetical protein